MAEFGRRKIKPGEDPAPVAEPCEKREEKKAPGWHGVLKVSIFAVLCAFGVLAVFNQAAMRVLKNGLASHTSRTITAAYQDDDMYTGVSGQTGYFSFLDNSGEHPEAKRRAEKLANNAVKRCHEALKKDIERRRRQGDGEDNAGSYERLLDDLGFYLPCIMTVNPRRFCSPNQKKDLVRRVEAYFNVLQAARDDYASRLPRLNTNSLSHVFFRLSEEIGGDEYRITSAPAMAQVGPDPRLLAALQDLIALGYLDMADFAAFFGLFVSSDIKQLFDNVKRQENSCQS